MSKLTAAVVVLFVMAIIAAPVARANTMTFTGLADHSASWTENGLFLTGNGDNLRTFTGPGTVTPASNLANWTFSLVGGGAFDLASITAFNWSGSGNITFTGHRADSSTVTQSGIGLITFAGFTNLTSVTFQPSISPRFAYLDTIVANPSAAVPEPSSFVLLGMGAMLILRLRKRG